MKLAHVREANISHLQSKYFIAKRFHLPEWANFVAHLLYRRCAVVVLFLLYYAFYTLKRDTLSPLHILGEYAATVALACAKMLGELDLHFARDACGNGDGSHRAIAPVERDSERAARRESLYASRRPFGQR